MAEKKPIPPDKKPSPRPMPRPFVVIDKKNWSGWLLTLFIISGTMFYLGVLVGRNTLPVRFDIDNLEEKLGNLKESVLKERGPFRKGAAQPMDVLTQLQEPGDKPSIYKQYVPPVIKPRFSKTDPLKDIAADELETSGAKEAAVTETGQAASVELAQTPGAAPSSATRAIESAATAPSLAPDAAGTSDAPQAATSESEPTEHTAPAVMTIKTARFSKPADSPAPAAKTPAPVESKPASAAEPTISPSIAALPETAAVVEPAVVDEPDATISPGPAAETIPEVNTPDAASPAYAIQVASLQDRENADSVKQKFMAKGYPAYAQSSEIKGVTWYRVRIGPYPNRAMAEKDCSSLKEAGVDGLVFRIEP